MGNDLISSKLLVKIVPYTPSVGQQARRHRQAPGETAKKAKCVFGVVPTQDTVSSPRGVLSDSPSIPSCFQILLSMDIQLNDNPPAVLGGLMRFLIYLSWDSLYKTKRKTDICINFNFCANDLLICIKMCMLQCFHLTPSCSPFHISTYEPFQSFITTPCFQVRV